MVIRNQKCLLSLNHCALAMQTIPQEPPIVFFHDERAFAPENMRDNLNMTTIKIFLSEIV